VPFFFGPTGKREMMPGFWQRAALGRKTGCSGQKGKDSCFSSEKQESY